MSKYIIDVNDEAWDPNNPWNYYLYELDGPLIQCRDCLNYCTEDGMPWCAVHFTPITGDGFCDSGTAKEEAKK